MERPKGPSAFALHLFAMACMLADHTALVFAPASAALLCVGRLAFPIFAFFVAEGSARTRSRGNYALRLGAAALAAEVPFDLMVYGRPFAPGGQNVLFTFLLALAALEIWQRVPAGVSGRLAGLCVTGAAALAAGLLRTDYGAVGVLTVATFALFRGDSARARGGQAVCLLLLHGLLAPSATLALELWSLSASLPLQSLALAALPLLWAYRGRQGPHGPAVRRAFYAFYPLHMLALWAVSRVLQVH